MRLRYIRCRETTFSRLRHVLDAPKAGQGMVEYALVVGLITVVVVVVLGVTGRHVSNVFSNISTDLGNLAAATKHGKKK